MSYEVLSDHDVSIPARDMTARRVDILIDEPTKADAAIVLEQASRELLTGDALTIYAYIEREAVKWQGWVGRVEYRADGVPKIFFDNDPFLREALYRELNEN